MITFFKTRFFFILSLLFSVKFKVLSVSLSFTHFNLKYSCIIVCPANLVCCCCFNLQLHFVFHSSVVVALKQQENNYKQFHMEKDLNTIPSHVLFMWWNLLDWTKRWWNLFKYRNSNKKPFGLVPTKRNHKC